jgi:hypothetical protein
MSHFKMTETIIFSFYKCKEFLIFVFRYILNCIECEDTNIKVARVLNQRINMLDNVSKGKKIRKD